MTPTCREANVSDLERVVDLLAELLGEHSLAPDRATLRAAVGRLVEDPQLGRVLVAESEGEIAGVAVLSWTYSLEQGGRSAWLDEIFVAPERRGRGIGASLLDAACAAAASAGACAVDLEVEAGHERVAALYERHGFARHRRERWYLALPPETPSPRAKDHPPREAISPGPPVPPSGAAGALLEGGCLCGSIRYRVAASDEVCHCHCSLCRRSSGAPFVTWVTVPVSDFAILRGCPATYRSTPQAVRSFCSECGTALCFRSDAQPDTIDITVASLDEPARLAPLRHIHTSSQLPWITLADGLPRHAASRLGG